MSSSPQASLVLLRRAHAACLLLEAGGHLLHLALWFPPVLWGRQHRCESRLGWGPLPKHLQQVGALEAWSALCCCLVGHHSS